MRIFKKFVNNFTIFSVSKSYRIEDNVESNGFDQHLKGLGLQTEAFPAIHRNNRFNVPTIEESFSAELLSQGWPQTVCNNRQPIVPAIDRNNQFTNTFHDSTIDESFGSGFHSQIWPQRVNNNRQPMTYPDSLPSAESPVILEPLPYSKLYPSSGSVPNNKWMVSSFSANVSKMCELSISEYSIKTTNILETYFGTNSGES